MEEDHWDYEASIQGLRSQIKEHPDFKDWIASLPSYTRGILDEMLVNKVTRDLIIAADRAPEEEYQRYAFLRALGNGTSDPTLAGEMTETALEIALWGIVSVHGADYYLASQKKG